MENWYNPNGESIVNGGAALRWTYKDNNEAELFVVRTLEGGRTAAFSGKLSEEVCCLYRSEIEEMTGEDFEDIFSGWEEREIANLYCSLAQKFPVTSFFEVQDVSGTAQTPHGKDAIKHFRAYDMDIRKRVRELGILI